MARDWDMADDTLRAPAFWEMRIWMSDKPQ